MPTELLNLTWQIQLALASGYAAYLICYAGIRGSHTTIDTTFSTLIFSLFATGTLYVTQAKLGDVRGAVIAFCAACLVAILWRRYLRGAFRWLLRKLDISWSNDDPSALATILGARAYVSQISVLTEDGTWLSCDNAEQFASSPFGPCQLGPNGDVALYLTSIKSADGTVTPIDTTLDSEWGDRVTYVPASKIKRITFRHSKKSTRP